MLITAPNSAAGKRMWHDPSPASETALKKYGARLLDILEAPLSLAAGKANELEPRRVALSAEARRVWIAFADYVEAAIAPNGDLEAVRGLANKLPEHAARLAVVLTLVDDIEATEITGERMGASIVLAQHYAAEALRLFGAARVSVELRLAECTLAWLLGPWAEPAVSLPDVYQLGPPGVRDNATAKKIVGILEDHGRLRPVPGGGHVAGVKRREVWQIVGGEMQAFLKFDPYAFLEATASNEAAKSCETC